MAEQSEQQQFAVLIDGDNAQASLLPQILAEVSKFGQITIKRIYGDWTTTNMNSWKEYLQKHAIQPMQQFRYTTGKNATDSALIIERGRCGFRPAIPATAGYHRRFLR